MNHLLSSQNHWTKAVFWCCAAALLTLIGMYINARCAKPVIVPPARPPLPTENGADKLLAAATLIKNPESIGNLFSGKGQKRVDWSEKRRRVAENQNALAHAKDALQYPYLEANYGLSANNNTTRYKNLRAMVWMVTLAGEVAWQEGEYGKSVDYYVDGIAIGRRIPHRTVLLGRLIGIACESIARHSLWDHVSEMDADTAVSVLKRLEALEKERLPLWETLEEDKYSSLCTIRQALEHPEQVYDGSDEIGPEGVCGNGEGGPMDTYGKIVPHKYIIDMVARNMDKVIACSKKPYIEGSDVPEPKDVYSATFVPVIADTRVRDTANNTADILLRTALALRIYQVRQGSFPTDLSELVAGNLLANPPEDPFAKPGTLLRYRVQPSGKYLLYSVGPDGVDDGGKGIAVKDAKGVMVRTVRSDSKGDMVAGWYGY